MRNILYLDEEGYVTGGYMGGVTEIRHGLYGIYRLPTFDIDFSNLTKAWFLLCSNLGLEEVLTNFSKVQIGEGMFRFCPDLRHVKYGFPSLVTGGDGGNTGGAIDGEMFHSCALPAEEIDKILESLPSYTDGPDKHRIGFTGCPGCATCHPEIGRNKGWNVVL